ncbi:hypothetical protein M9H77_21138 [Catharanthus roseus]|uniref:Uncharacterized protein n=1 Tax=Catharanthus roseus TaxID=4058 RepID=A0ACC0AN79_CATRO|nr:hypothetical protein M9H77_21138 [Catharanthus roseus]
MAMLLFFVFALLSTPMSSYARILYEGKNINSLTLFHELGFQLHKRDQMSFVDSKREVPGGPNPRHNYYQPGTNSHYHLATTNSDASKFQDGVSRDAPSGSDPHYHLVARSPTLPIYP